MKILKIILGALFAIAGFYLAVWSIMNPTICMPYAVYAVVLLIPGGLFLYSGIRGLFADNDDSDEGEHRCFIHKKQPAAQRCRDCGRWTCEIGARKNDDGSLTCPDCLEGERLAIESANIPRKSRTVAVLLCLFLGLLGIHRIYLGKLKSGLAMLLLMIVGFWTIIIPVIFVFIVVVDLITIVSGNITDQYRRKLV